MDRRAPGEVSSSAFHWVSSSSPQEGHYLKSCLRAFAQAAPSGWSATPSFSSPSHRLHCRLHDRVMPSSCLCHAFPVPALLRPAWSLLFFCAPTRFLKHKNSHTMSSPCPAESGIQYFCRTNHCTQWYGNLQCGVTGPGLRSAGVLRVQASECVEGGLLVSATFFLRPSFLCVSVPFCPLHLLSPLSLPCTYSHCRQGSLPSPSHLWSFHFIRKAQEDSTA